MRRGRLGAAALCAVGLGWPATTGATTIEISRGAAPAESQVLAYGVGHDRLILPTRLVIARGSTVVAQDVNANAAVVRGATLVAGDVITVERPVGTPQATLTFDGTPTVEACAPNVAFAGSRTPGASVTARILQAVGAGSNPFRLYGIPSAPSADRYAATFAAPFYPGQRARVQTQVSPSADVLVRSTLTAPIPGCAVPIAAAPVVDRLAPTGRLFKLSAASLKTAIRRLLKGTFTDVVTVSEPGKVAQRLVAVDGRIPASAAAAKKKVKAATLLAKGTATAKKAGKVTVKLKLTSAGKRKLRRAKRAKVALVTTISDRAGNKRTLAVARFTVRRP